MNKEQEEKGSTPLPIEPGHVMSKQKYEQMLKAQQKQR